MFGNYYFGNRYVDCVWWIDKNGEKWAQAVSANAASQIGTEPFKPTWSLTGTFIAEQVYR